jgi:lipid A 3-O-deacylase
MYKMVWASALLASAALAASAASPASAGEVVVGGFAHDTTFGVSGSAHEQNTADIQLMYRTHQFQIPWLLDPMAYAKAQINTGGRTNFFTVGAEWRKHLFHSRFYGDFGVGGAYVDGYNTYPDHFDPSRDQPPPAGSPPAAIARYQSDLSTYNRFKAMGSDFVFNPNFALGYDVTEHISVEIAWDHYSNAGLGGRNPGLDTFGGRLAYRFGGPF